MTKEDDDDFEKSAKCWICDNVYVDDVKVRDHCCEGERSLGSAHRDCIINVM